jgi:hypothetical protein
VGLAAWQLDLEPRGYALISRVFAGEAECLTRDDVLDNITLYWLTNTAISSAVSIGKTSSRISVQKAFQSRLP